MTKTTYDVAIIGGGMVGAAIAYHCARRGMRTALLEKSHLAAGGSGGNFGLVLWSTGRPDLPFALERERDGFQRVLNLPEALDFDMELRPAHGHCLMCTEEEVAMFAGHRDMFTAASGLDERIITPDELREAEPNMHVSPEVIAALQTDEAVLNPMLLVQGYWRAAQRHGADLHAYTPVVGFDQSAGRITAIRTPTGAISAGEVIVAAGSWTREVALMAGVSLPEYFIHAEAVVTEPIPPLLNGFAYWANALRVPEEARIAIESMSAGWESRGDETLFGGYDFGTVQTVHGNMLFGQMSYINPACSYDVGSQVVTDSAREALRMFPQLNKLRVIRSWRSFAPFTPDHLPLVGRVEAPQNLSIASGYASAITLCDWSGEFMADLISGAPTDPEAAIFDPMRFPQPIAV